MDTKQAFKNRLCKDPVFFCRHILGIEPWGKQLEVLEALCSNDRVAVRSGHGTGKSFIASAAALWFLYSHYPAKVITTAPTWNQVRQILWSEIRKMHSASRIPLGGKVLEERIKLTDGAFAVGLSTDEAERFQGFHAENVLVILDEAPGVREDIWEAAETLLTGSIGKILAIGNPTKASGLFFDAFKDTSSWKKIRISCLDSPNVKEGKILFPRLVTSRWVESRRRDWGEDTALWKSRILGEFPDDSASVLIPRNWLEKQSAPEDTNRKGALRLGVDVAREGTDSTVFLCRDDNRIIFAEEQHGWSTMQVVGRVIDLTREHEIDAEDVYIDDTGLGAGVTDRLREQELNINAIICAARASEPTRYINTRAQMFWRLRESLNPEPAGANTLYIPPHLKQLRHELCSLGYEFSSTGAIKISSKIQLRGKLKGSPNFADALALTFAERKQHEPQISIF